MTSASHIAFILNNVTDYQTLVAGIPEGTPVYVLDANGNALEEMARILGGYRNLEAIHLLSHGSPGAINLGALMLTSSNLGLYRNTLAQVGATLTKGGSLLVYGCNVAKGAQGESFIIQLAQITGTNIAASTDWTGAASLGGNWTLEYTTGNINHAQLLDATSAAGYDHLLNTLTTGNDAPTFIVTDGTGTALIPVGSGDDYGRSVTVQPDGKILVAGYSSNGSNNDFSLIRLNADGSLDSGFDGDGKALIPVGSSADNGRSVTLQPDGKILVAGYSSNGSNNDFSLIRLNADGSLDSGFDGDGKALIPVASGDDNGQSVIVQPDGKILVAGYSIGSNGYNFSLVRLNADGSLDSGFDGDGTALIPGGSGTDDGQSITLQPDGKILVASSSFNGSYTDFSLIRLNADGSLDSGFDGDGKAVIPVGNGDDYGYSVTLQPDGKILVAGNGSNGHDFSLMRLNADGSLDTSFDGDGTALIPVGSSTDNGYSLALQPGGKILVAGSSYNGSNGYDFSLVRLHTYGSLDTSFSDDGKALIPVGSGNDIGRSVTLQSDGKILVAGYSDNGSNGYDFSVIRLNADGSLDTSFNGSAVNTLDGAPAYTENGIAVVLDADVRLFDTELSAANNFDGATLTLARHGGASADDVFSATGTLGALTEGGALVVGGTTLGTVTSNSGGTLALSFNASATQALVNSAMQQIAYANRSDAPPTSAQIDWTFSDGNSGAQGTGGALTAIGSTTVSITAVNDTPTAISLSNATASAYDTNNTAVGSLTRTDVDGGGPTYSIVSVDTNTSGAIYDYFTISGTTLQITNPGNTPVGSYAVVVQVNDGTSTYDQSFNLSVSNTLVVDTTGDNSHDGKAYSIEKADDGGLSLREAIVFANQAGGGTISFASGLGSLTLSSSASLSQNITLDADVVDTLSIAGELITTSGKTLTLSNAAGDALTLSGDISGGGNLVKTGAGTLTLSSTSNSSAAATLTVTAGTVSVSSDSQLVGGSLTLNGGTLNLNNAGTVDNAIALDSGNGTISVTNGAATLSGNITGTGSLTKTGGQLLTLSGTNTYSGGTTVRGAAGLSITDGSNIGSGTLTLEADLTITSSTTISNAIALNAAATITNANAVSLSGVLSGSSDLTKAGAGTLTLGGTNTHSGAVTVSAGGLRVEGGSSIGDSSAVTVASGATLTLNGGSETIGSLAGAGSVVLGYGLTLGGDNTNTTFSGVISGTNNGINKTGTGTLTLSGTNTYTGSTTVSAGGLTLHTGNNLSDSSAVTVASGATLTLNGGNETIGSLAGAGSVALGSNTLTLGDSTSTTYSGVMSGTGALTKSGTGTLTLSGTNTYTGATSVSAGTLVVDGTLASSAVSVANTAKLSGTGTINGAVTLSSGGSIEAGVSLGTLTLSNGLTLSSGSTLVAEVKGTAAGTGYDQISVVGTVDITGATLSTDLGSFIPTSGNTFTLIDNDGSDAVIGTFNGLAEGAAFNAGGYTLSLSYAGGDGNDVVLAMATPTVTAVSAPSSSTYIAGQHLDFTITLSESVTLDTTGGIPRLVLDIGGTTKYATYLSGSGTTQLNFRYTLESGLTDTDGITVSSLDANGGTLRSGISIDADLTLNGIASMTGVKVDSTVPNAPSITGISTDTGSSSSDGYTSDTTLVISGTAEANATVTVFKDSAQLGTATANGSGAWSYDYTGSALTIGSHSFTATATDIANNVSSASTSYAVAVDTTAPSDITLSTASTPPASAVANAALSTLSSTDVSVGDSFTYQLVSGVGDTDNASFAISGSTLKVAGTALAVGSYSVRVQSTDKAGNTFEKVLTFTVAEDTAPTPEPTPTPSLPPISEWPNLPDNDGDGIPDQVETLVPSLTGGVTGDGNGDGIADTQQTNVASIPFRDTEQVTQDPNAPVVFITLASDDAFQVANVTQQDAPDDKPDSLSMPLGLISFTAQTDTSTANFELLVDGDIAVNGYWKQDASGNWVNLASEAFGGSVITLDGTTRLSFTIEDGGEFDDDGLANGVITDPGAIGFSSNQAPSLSTPVRMQGGFMAGQIGQLPSFGIADANADQLTLTLTTSNGTLSHLDTAAGSLQWVGTADQINAALAHANLTPARGGLAHIGFTLSDGSAPPVTRTYTLAVAPSSPADQWVVLQQASPAVLGAGTGDDTYLISGSMLPANTEITLTDTRGSNSIQFAEGLSIKASKVANATLQLTLENGSLITVLDADEFTYDIGGNTSAGIDNADISYARLVADVLGVALPSNNSVTIGSAVSIDTNSLSPTLQAATLPSQEDQFIVMQHSSPAILGAGAGDDTYLISGFMLPIETEILLSDTRGSNRIQLAEGLSITTSKVTSNAVQLTLESGAVITILDAQAFTYDIGGNTSAGIDHADVSYTHFVQQALGVTLPTGNTMATGQAVVISTEEIAPLALLGIAEQPVTSLLPS